MKDTSDLIVIGAGIAGLSAAVTALDAGVRPLVLDAHEPGGRARTTEKNGYLHNIGPHALYRGGHLHGLLAQHGITLPGGQPDTTNVRLLRDGILTPLTMRAHDLARTPLLSFSHRMKLLALFAKLPRIKPAELVGRSVTEWLADVPRPVAQMVEMLIRTSTYANAPDQLDAGAAVAQVQLALKDGVDYLDGGWQRIVDALAHDVTSRGGTIVTGAEVSTVGTDAGWVAVNVGDSRHVARSVVVATGGPATATRLTGAPVANAGNLTAAVEASSLDLALRTPRPGLVFGLDEPLYLSPHAPVARLAPDGGGLVSVVRYTPVGQAPDAVDATRARLRAFAAHAGIADDDVVHDRYQHRLVVSHGTAAAAGGGTAGRPTVDALGIPGVFLAGDWVGPTGLIGDAAAASGEAAALAAVRHCASVAA